MKGWIFVFNASQTRVQIGSVVCLNVQFQTQSCLLKPNHKDTGSVNSSAALMANKNLHPTYNCQIHLESWLRVT